MKQHSYHYKELTEANAELAISNQQLLEQIKALEAERARYRQALIRIAMFHDEAASEKLSQTGRYSRFDEPVSVEIARKALAEEVE